MAELCVTRLTSSVGACVDGVSLTELTDEIVERILAERRLARVTAGRHTPCRVLVGRTRSEEAVA